MFHFDPQLFTSTFGLIALAELPDKTMLATLCLATRFRPLPVFVGTAIAFVIQNTIAVSLGSVIGLLPGGAVHVAAGILFLVFALVMLLNQPATGDEDKAAAADSPTGFLKAAWISLALLFVSEWGDLTQLTTAGLAATYRQPLTVFLGSTFAHWVVAAIAILAGNRIAGYVQRRLLQQASAAAFAVLGFALLATR